ncbi:hypothetical protein NUH88_05910 [Nisaea acidiphila]|uniref:Type II toxin-antitoxin system ParD family antitoxin n=1 Tax=Nisaea acidiphila TaxID=1862145 RepID=A0A9J7AV70_9PROT|nr:hypothetical protein [Nisaea acidiphila]UUX51224.1 hypothetical protein NUH88_05910 [Nisaea acidiphila]
MSEKTDTADKPDLEARRTEIIAEMGRRLDNGQASIDGEKIFAAFQAAIDEGIASGAPVRMDLAAFKAEMRSRRDSG